MILFFTQNYASNVFSFINTNIAIADIELYILYSKIKLKQAENIFILHNILLFAENVLYQVLSSIYIKISSYGD